MTPMRMERRAFLQTAAAGSLVLTISGAGCRRMDEALSRKPRPPELTITPVAYVRVDDTGTVTIVVHRSEMGQGVRTSVAMIIADELEADWTRVVVEQAPGDAKTYGSQNTDGSTSIRDFLPRYREAGATVRMLLQAAAAAQWKVPATECTAQMHEVLHTPTGRRVGFGALVATAKDLPLPAPESLTYKEPSQYRYVGKAIPIVDLHAMTVGTATYGQDMRREGMKYAVVARPPVYGASITSLDSSEAEQVPGVEKIIRLPDTSPPSGFNALGGVAVVAANTWAALQGRSKLKITWSEGPNASYDSTAYRAELERSARRSGEVVRRQGNAPRAIAASAQKVTADYYLPHLAHAQMEPPAALAVFANGKLEIWACTQNPQAARDTVASVLKMPVEDVAVQVTLLGGGFGRKSKPDFIVEAAFLARELQGTVKVVWTREDDIQHDYFHTVAVEHLEAGLDAKGRVTGWLHRSALPSIGSTFAPNVTRQSLDEASLGMTDLPFALEHYQAETATAIAHTRIGWYRSVTNVPHAFAIGSFVDELAHAAGRDPKEFLLELLGPDRKILLSQVGIVGEANNYDTPLDKFPVDIARYKGVLEAVANKSGWGTPVPAGEGRGIAVHRSFLSYVAAVVRVRVTPEGVVEVPRVDIAIDAGFVAHPERVRSQLEGAAIMAISNTLYSGITFARGRPVETNYTTYRVTRLSEAPREIVAQVITSNESPGGVGEPGVPPVGPALANAIFAATGRRIRSLPVGDQLKAPPVA